MKSKILILHLSDAHLGNPSHDSEVTRVFEPLFKDLGEISMGYGKIPDLIIFSGDLVFGNTLRTNLDDQYVKASEFLSEITSSLGKAYGEIPILIVPGNHDNDRTLVDDGQKLTREQMFREDTYVDKMIADNNRTWKRFQELQERWFTFAQKIPGQPWDWDPIFRVPFGILEFGTWKVGVVGLNTSWASLDDQDLGRLWVGRRQLLAGYDRIKNANIRIAVGHHPFDWLNPCDKEDIYQKIETQFHAYFHGHEHSQWFLDTVKHLKVAAGACYSGPRKNTYSWLLITPEERNCEIRLREYTDQSVGGWRANYIPGKTNSDGTALVSFLKGEDPKEEAKLSSSKFERVPFDSVTDLIEALEYKMHFRWERGNLEEIDTPAIYWPVRLRQPTPIHAAQCFVAAGLQKQGCEISLWVDDLGRKEYPPEAFITKLKRWFGKAGGDIAKIEIRKFTEVLNDEKQHVGPAWEMLQRWLGTMVYFTDHVLKVSKIWSSTEEPSKEDPTKILNEFSRRRPRRLMTPSMVWTCLTILHEDKHDKNFLTLGGYDEKALWDAWRTCCELPTIQVGHLYIPKLTHKANGEEVVVHMAENPLCWESKEDIEKAFRVGLSDNDTPNVWTQFQTIIPWTINNCVLLPNYVAGSEYEVKISDRTVTKISDLVGLKPSEVFSDLVDAVHSWLL